MWEKLIIHCFHFKPYLVLCFKSQMQKVGDYIRISAFFKKTGRRKVSSKSCGWRESLKTCPPESFRVRRQIIMKQIFHLNLLITDITWLGAVLVKYMTKEFKGGEYEMISAIVALSHGSKSQLPHAQTLGGSAYRSSELLHLVNTQVHQSESRGGFG